MMKQIFSLLVPLMDESCPLVVVIAKREPLSRLGALNATTVWVCVAYFFSSPNAVEGVMNCNHLPFGGHESILIQASEVLSKSYLHLSSIQ